MAVPGQIQLTVVRMNDRVPLPRASESNRIRFSAAQGRESDNGQCLNPGHNDGCHRLHKAAVTGLVEGSKGLSSSTYVVGELDTSRRGEDGEWIQEILRSAILIRTPPRCGHSGTVCRDCAETWMFDWVFPFDRTAGGRRLRDELGGEKALAAMAERRTRAEGAVARRESPGRPCPDPGHARMPQDACSGCCKALSAELTALGDRHMRLMTEAGEDRRKAREAAGRGEIVPLPLPHNRASGTESAPQGFEAVMATSVLQVRGRCKPPAEDEVVLCVLHRTTGGGRSVLLERSQVEALHEWLGKWLAEGWPGVPRKCGRHYSDDLGEWRCDQEPGHDGDCEGNPVGWRSGRKPGRASWPRGRS